MTDSGLSILVAHRGGQSGADLEYALKSFGYPVTLVADLDLMQESLAESNHFVLMLDSDLLPAAPASMLGDIVARQIDLAVVVITGSPSMKSVVAALRSGAYDYLTIPYSLDQLEQCIQRAAPSHERLAHRLQAETADADAAGC